MTEGSSIAMEARFATLQESLDSDSGDHFSLWREVDPFPVVLHRMLGDMENEGTEHVISWNDDGMSFTIHKPKEFAATILTRYFRNQTRYKSFQRQLNLYRFHRISTAKERAAYAHKSFARDSPHLCRFVRRTRKQPRIPEVTGTHPNPPIENFPFIPTMLPFELSLTHSATSGVKNNPSLYGKQHLKSPCPITCMNPCANLEVSSPPLLAPTKPLPCPTPKFPGEFNREPSENQMSILAWLASLRPVDAVASIDKAWDDVSMGSIDHDDWTTSSSLILANHDDSLSWACSSFDGEIFP